jgi:DNA-binding MarR family transcriptional regulator
MKLNVGNLFGSKKEKIGTRSVYQITALGKQKADKADIPGNRWRILNILDENPCSIKEIADDTGLPEDKIKGMVKDMMESGYIRKSGMDGG